MTQIIKPDPSDAGCWLDNSRGRYLAGDIVEEAIAWGYRPSPEYNKALDELDEVDSWEYIQDEADDAEEWMNEHVAPKGFYFGTNPDWGDWGMYSAIMGRTMSDLAGSGPFYTKDLLEFILEEEPEAMLVFNRKSFPAIDVVRYGFFEYDLPDYVEVTEVNRVSNEKWGLSENYIVTLERA